MHKSDGDIVVVVLLDDNMVDGVKLLVYIYVFRRIQGETVVIGAWRKVSASEPNNRLMVYYINCL